MDYTTIIDTTTSSQSSAVFYGLMGAASGLILSTIGAAYGRVVENLCSNFDWFFIEFELQFTNWLRIN